MDRRAQGRSQRLILRAHLADVVQLRSKEISRALSGRAACRRARAAFQTDAGHDPVRALTNRLLAAESFSNGENHLVAHGKNSVRPVRRSLGGYHGAGPTRPHRHLRLLSAVTIRKYNR